MWDLEVEKEITGRQYGLVGDIMGEEVREEESRFFIRPWIGLTNIVVLATGKWESLLITKVEETFDTWKEEDNSRKGITFSLKVTCFLAIFFFV